MPTLVCQYTGFEFESPTRRGKNHPLVSAFLNEVSDEMKYDRRRWDAAVDLLAANRGEHSTIENLIAAVRAQYAEWKAQQEAIKRIEAEDARRREQERESRRRRRQAINDILRQHNYRWSKEGFVDEEDADAFGGWHNAPIGQYWTLRAPDGREVSVEQAFSEIGQPVPTN